MGKSQKSKKVSWATDVNLCQVRLFLSEETPSQVAVGTHDHLQAKPWLHAGGMGSDDNLPPGFEEIQPVDPWAGKLSQISLAKWKCPPRFAVDSSWQVVAGEESKEIETQNQREMRVLEAIYPRPSAIPLNPAALVGAEESTHNDQFTPVVPFTAIEDEDASLDTSYSYPSMTSNATSTTAHPPHRPLSSELNPTLRSGVEPDIITAAQAALSSVMPNSDQIDRNLLMKILSDRKIIEQLNTNHAASSTAPSLPSASTFHGTPLIGSESVITSSTRNIPPSSSQYTPNLVPPPKNSFLPVNHRGDPHSPHSVRTMREQSMVARPETVVPPFSVAPRGPGPFHPPVRPSLPDMASGPTPSPSVPKDIKYYKSLIQQHGGERREAVPQFPHQEPLNNIMMRPSRDSKGKMIRPCIYFNSSRGCRNGANCAFQHEAAAPQQKVNSMPEVQGTKRVKLDREISHT